MLTLKDYQKLALRTAMPEAFQHSYLIPSIVGEIGELFGKRGKAERDHGSQDRLNEALVGEYGDVAWMTAILLHMHDVEVVEDVNLVRRFIKDPWRAILFDGAFLYLMHSIGANDAAVKRKAVQLWATLEENCEEITGSPFYIVLRHNAAKLRSRQARGVLTGSGDNR